MKQVYCDWVDTEFGMIWLLATQQGGVCSVRFITKGRRTLGEIPPNKGRTELSRGRAIVRRAAQQICEYLRDERRKIVVRLDMSGLSSFEESVLRAVRGIPYGETRAYARIAAQIGESGSARHVHDFLARNPLPLLVPCHRVVGTKGLGRYVGGRSLKAKLLEKEKIQIGLGF